LYLLLLPATVLRYWSADPSYARKFPLFISIDGDDQRTLLLATAMHQAAGVQVITRRCVLQQCVSGLLARIWPACCHTSLV
jgi:hypothetical protein